MWSRNGLLVCVLQELHILFVPLLHALQYHLALVSLQLQSLDLNDDTINFKDKKKNKNKKYSNNAPPITPHILLVTT